MKKILLDVRDCTEEQKNKAVKYYEKYYKAEYNYGLSLGDIKDAAIIGLLKYQDSERIKYVITKPDVSFLGSFRYETLVKYPFKILGKLE